MAKAKENAATEAKAKAEAKRDALQDAEAKDSPVLTLITKRLRASRKKIKKVEEIEAIKASGREINSDQEESLKGKTKTLANIEELDRLLPLLKEAVAAEVSQKLDAVKEEIEAAAIVKASEKAAEEAKTVAEAHDVENSKAKALADELKAQVEEAAEKAAAEEAKRAQENAENEVRMAELQASEKTSVKEAVTRLLQLTYFSKLFSIEGRNEQDYLHQMERDACISYVADAGDVLHQEDFNAICHFGKLISSRPQGELISHETALERCKAFALDWVEAAETPIPSLNSTVHQLVVKFESIIGSGFYTIKPEMKGAHEVNSKGFLDGSIPTPPGRDVNANNFSTSFGALHSIPHLGTTSLQHILGHHTQQVPESQSSTEHGLPNGFIPYSSGFKPSASSAFAGSLPGTSIQAAGLTDSSSQKPQQAASETQFQAPSFQASSFVGSAPKPEAGQAGIGRSGSGSAAFLPTASPAAATAEVEAPSAGPPAAQPATAKAEAPTETVQQPERKNSYSTSQGTRPRPQEGSRGRGAPRGRGGGRDFVPRGGGRRQGSGRGSYRGRGREGGSSQQSSQPTYAQQVGSA